MDGWFIGEGECTERMETQENRTRVCLLDLVRGRNKIKGGTWRVFFRPSKAIKDGIMGWKSSAFSDQNDAKFTKFPAPKEEEEEE